MAEAVTEAQVWGLDACSGMADALRTAAPAVDDRPSLVAIASSNRAV